MKFENHKYVAKFKKDEKDDPHLRAIMLVFYCKLILIEMSHSSLRQKEIITKNGDELLITLQDFSKVEQ